MDTKLRDDATTALFDKEVLAIIERATFDGGGNTMRFAIRNEAGAIYRSVRTVGMRELMDFTGAMARAGFVDELREVMTMREGFDGIFRRP